MTWGTAPAASAPRSQEEDDEPLVAYTMCSRRRQGQCSQCGTKDLGFAHETPEGVYVTGEEADYCKKCKTFGPRVLVDWEPKPNGKYKAHYCGEKQKANGEHPRDVPGETEADGDGESGGLGDEPETEPDNQAGDLDLKPKSELNEDGTPKQKDEKPDPKAGDAKDSDVDPWTGEAYEIPKFKPKLPPRPGSEGGGQDASDGAPQMPEAAQQPPPEAPEAPQFQSPQNQEGDGESDSDSDEPDYVTHPELDERSNEISEQVLKLATDYTKEYTDVVGRNIVSHVETRFAHVMEVGARNAKQFREEMERNVTRSRKYTDERIAEAIGNGFGGGKGETHFIKIGDKPKKALPELHHRTLPTLISMLAGGEHVGMVGTAAAGKGKLARQAAEALGRKFYALPGSLSPQTTVSQIMGYMNANGNYVRTLYRDAFEHGGVMFFDELDNAHPAAMASVNDGLAIQAGDEIAFPDGMVKRHPDFIVVAAMNTWGRGPDQLYAARQRGDAATWDRLALLAVEIDAQLEMTLCHRTGADTRIVGEVNRYIRALRKRAATEFPSQPILLSMRASIGLCKLLAAGVDDETAVDVRVRRGMSDQDWAKLTSGIRPLEVML